jgi:multiple sugar transport system substrate-binding protein
MIMTGVSRRKFLKTTGAGAVVASSGGLAGILATGRAPAHAQPTTVHWLRHSDFVPACDALLRNKLLPEAEKQLGIKVRYETVNANDLQPRITSGIQSGAGPDLIMLWNNHPHLYRASLVDVSDVAGEIAKDQGEWYKLCSANSSSGGKFFSMPMAIVCSMNAYRKSWFAEAGHSEFPTTWDQYRDAGRKLKAMGYPIGQSFGQSFGDPGVFAYPLLWSFGGAEIDDKGKVVINSKATVDAVKWMTSAWTEAFDEGGLAWDDSSNNRAFLTGTICSTLNAASIYIEALRKPEQYKQQNGNPLKDDIAHAPLPAGPAGQFAFHGYTSHVMPSYSKNQTAAKDLLRFIHKKENYDQWFQTGLGLYTPCAASWETHELWRKDPVMAPYALAGKFGLTPGYPGEPNIKAAEVLTKYLIGNMFAGGIRGQKAEDAVAACEAQLKKIYES